MKHKSEGKLISSMLVKYCTYSALGKELSSQMLKALACCLEIKPLELQTHEVLIICTTTAHTGGSYEVGQYFIEGWPYFIWGWEQDDYIYNKKDFEEVMTVGKTLSSSSEVRLIHFIKSRFKTTQASTGKA